MPIEHAPPRVRLAYYRQERRNNVIAVVVIASAISLLAWGIWKVFF